MTEIKRNTTPNIPITITGANMDDITEVRFAFKLKDDEVSECIIEKQYNTKLNSENFFKENDESFVVSVKLSTEETMKIPKGVFYVDVLPIAKEEVLDAGPPIALMARGTYFNEVIKV